MQTLFHTQRYARLQELAKARHDTLAGQYEQVRQRREQCLADLGIASEEELPDKEKAWQDKSAAVDAQWHEAETRRQTCQSAFQAAQTLENHWLLREQKRREAAQLQDQAGRFQENRDTIAILRQAEILAEPCRHLDDLEKEGKEAHKAAEKARKLAEKAEKDLAEAQRQLAALSARESGYKAACEERVQLTGLQEKAGPTGTAAWKKNGAARRQAKLNGAGTRCGRKRKQKNRPSTRPGKPSPAWPNRP